MMKVLGINSSGREHGNNESILKLCLQSFEKNNDDTGLISLGKLNIEGCKSCYGCKKGVSTCVIEDDMTNISKKVMESDLIIMGMPIYMWQITAQAKLFMERLYPFYHFDKPSELKGKKLVLIFTQATADEKLFKSYFEHIKQAMIFLGFDVVETIIVAGLRQPDDYTSHTELLEQIAGLGNRLLSDKLIEAI